MRLRLVLRHLRSHPLRSLLTCASVAVAVFLLCFLKAILTAITAGVEAASTNRLVVQSAVSLFVPLPLTYQAKIEQVDGVESTIKWTWFGGIYETPKNMFAQFAIDHDRLQQNYPEIALTDGTWDAFLGDRRGCLVGRDIAKKFDWQVGETVPLIGAIYPRPGGDAWEFVVSGIYETEAANIGNSTMFFRHDYFDETLEQEVGAENLGAGVYVIRLKPGIEPAAVMAGVDALFVAGPLRTLTTTEAEFNRQFVSMMGNIPMFLSSIGGGVLFAIFLAALNTMLMAGRERTRSIGILKAIGFTDRAAFGLLMLESLILCGLGGLIGVALAVGSSEGFANALGTMFPGYMVEPEIALLGLATAIGIGFLAAIIPASIAGRLRPVNALRMEA